jgi:DNA-binding transcriptional MerR regulator
MGCDGKRGTVLQIGEAANRVGLSLRTIRHWGEVGLVVPSGRSAGGFRLYTEDDVERMLFIKSLKPLDLSLEQIRDLVDLVYTARARADVASANGAGEAGDDGQQVDLRNRLSIYQALAEARVEALRGQLRDLEGLSRELKSLSRPSHDQATRRAVR